MSTLTVTTLRTDIIKSSSTEANSILLDSSGNTILNGGKLIGTRSGRCAEFTNTDSINDTAGFFATNASFGSGFPITVMRATRSNDSSWLFLICDSNNGSDVEFILRGDGNAYAENSWNGGGADYAEYFEWLDGNSNNEDRRGYTVVLDGDKIRKANSGEVPIGVISTNPATVGDSAWNNWNQKYLKDDFGSYIFEYHNVVEWETTEIDNNGNPKTISHSYEDWNLPEDLEIPENAIYKSHDDAGNAFKHKVLNPDYNPDLEYITREDRPEWDMVGLLGKLRIRKGQPVDSRWIKMKDISENVEQWLVR